MGILGTLFAAGAGAAQNAELFIQSENKFKRQQSLADYNHQKALELEKVRQQNNKEMESIRFGNEMGKMGVGKQIDRANSDAESEREEKEWEERQKIIKKDKISEEERAAQRKKDEARASSAKDMIKIKTDYLLADVQQKINEKWAEEMASAPPAAGGLLGSPADNMAEGTGGGSALPRDRFGNTRPPQISSVADALAWSKKYGLEDYANSIDAWINATTTSKEYLDLDGVNEIYKALFPEEEKPPEKKQSPEKKQPDAKNLEQYFQ